VNYHLPPTLMDGPATVVTTTGNGSIFTESIRLAATAPGLFSVNANGQGPAAALVLRVKANNEQQYEPAVHFDPVQNRWLTVPIEFGAPTDRLFLLLFATGARNVSSQSSASVTIGEVMTNIAFVGPLAGLVGTDQVNVELPRILAGRGEVDVVLTVGTQASNAVKINFK
jgi:uncharacterized protein (TIGR03437 family)